MPEHVSRRDFVALVGGVTAAEVIPAVAEAQSAPKKRSTKAPPKAPAFEPLENRPEAYTFFTAPEAAFVEAAGDRRDERVLQETIREAVRQALAGAAGYGPASARGGEADVRDRPWKVVLRDALCEHESGLLFRSDVRREPEQDRLEVDRAPRRPGRVQCLHRSVQRPVSGGGAGRDRRRRTEDRPGRG